MKVFALVATVLTLGSYVAADNFANFFNDDNCQVGGGIGVDITNDGCLGQNGRRSVYIPRAFEPAKSMCLVMTEADGTCSCQNEGYNFTPTGFCAKLDPKYKSFRFIEEACGPNNCP